MKQIERCFSDLAALVAISDGLWFVYGGSIYSSKEMGYTVGRTLDDVIVLGDIFEDGHILIPISEYCNLWSLSEEELNKEEKK